MLFEEDLDDRNEPTIEFQVLFLQHFCPDLDLWIPVLCSFAYRDFEDADLTRSRRVFQCCQGGAGQETYLQIFSPVYSSDSPRQSQGRAPFPGSQRNGLYGLLGDLCPSVCQRGKVGHPYLDRLLLGQSFP